VTTDIIIETLNAAQARMAIPDMIALLQDAVAGGASIGFLETPDDNEAGEYWRHVVDDMARDTRLLLVARKAHHLVGAVQLALETRPNGRHRAEVQKLIVLQHERQQGIGKRLMLALDDIARQQGRTLLVLDTRQGDAAERLYRRLGYVEAGVIPHYAQNSHGAFDATILFYRRLR
jgi:acetyltransferase